MCLKGTQRRHRQLFFLSFESKLSLISSFCWSLLINHTITLEGELYHHYWHNRDTVRAEGLLHPLVQNRLIVSMSRTLSKMWRCLAVEESDVFMSIWYLIDLIQNVKKTHVHNNTTTTKCGEFFYSFRKIEGLLVLLTEENVANKACWIVICLLLETTNLTTSASTILFFWNGGRFPKNWGKVKGRGFFVWHSQPTRQLESHLPWEKT